MPTAEEVLVRACNLPRDLRSENLSAIALVAASGYLECGGQVTVPAIKAHFAANPGLVRDWIQFSEDKRVDEGWYILAKSTGGPYIVGYYPDDLTRPEDEFGEVALACATFVKRELDSIAHNARKPGGRTMKPVSPSRGSAS